MASNNAEFDAILDKQDQYLREAFELYGVDTHMKPNEHSSLKNLLLIPFQPHRYPIRKK